MLLMEVYDKIQYSIVLSSISMTHTDVHMYFQKNQNYAFNHPDDLRGLSFLLQCVHAYIMQVVSLCELFVCICMLRFCIKYYAVDVNKFLLVYIRIYC